MGVIQKDLNLSNKVVTLAEDLRVFAGSRNVIETGLKRKLRERNRQLNELFETRKSTFATENMKEKKSRSNFQQHVVVCNDRGGHVPQITQMQYIWNNRDWDYLTYIFLKGMRQNGGKYVFLKICGSIAGGGHPGNARQ